MYCIKRSFRQDYKSIIRRRLSEHFSKIHRVKYSKVIQVPTVAPSLAGTRSPSQPKICESSLSVSRSGQNPPLPSQPPSDFINHRRELERSPLSFLRPFPYLLGSPSCAIASSAVLLDKRLPILLPVLPNQLFSCR